MKICKLFLLLACLCVILSGCGLENTGDTSVAVDYYGKTNGKCGGCCSHHGGVACGTNGKTICADGTPLSETCRNKGCRINNCGDAKEAECIAIAKEKEGALYTEFQVDEQMPSRDKIYGGGGWHMIDLPERTLSINFKIYPVHASYQPDRCNFDILGYKPKIAFYTEIECIGCDEMVRVCDGEPGNCNITPDNPDGCCMPYYIQRYRLRPCIIIKLKNGFDIYYSYYTSSFCNDLPEYLCDDDTPTLFYGWMEFPWTYDNGKGGRNEDYLIEYNMEDIKEIEVCFVSRSNGDRGNYYNIPMFNLR